MKLRIKELTLRNFKGVTSFTLATDGDDVSVLGDNATGKTTIVDAWCWLLFGKDSNGKTDFEIKTLEPTGEAKHGLEHSVTATIESIDDGRTATRMFRKAYKEKWQKKRGSADKEFTGHTTDHFIDDVPMKKKEFDGEVAKIAAGEIFRLLTDPIEFAERMKWQDRRELLLRVCGDVSDEEVIALDSSLVDLSEILSTRSIDDHRKVVMARRKDINQQLERIPIRIDEATRSIPPASVEDESTVMKRLDGDRIELKDLVTQLQRVKAGGEVAERTKELRELEARVIDVESQIRTAEAEGSMAAMKQVTEKRSELTRVIAELETVKTIITGLDGQIEGHTIEIAKMREEWALENETKIEVPPDETTCSACGQTLPPDRIERARRRAEEDFNERKSLRLQEIDERGQRRRDQKADVEKMIASRGKQLKELEENRNSLEAEVLKLENGAAEISDADSSAIDELNDRRKKLKTRVDDMEKSIARLRASNTGYIETIDSQIMEVQSSIALSEAKLTKFDQARTIEERIDELKAEERKLSAEFENLERELYLLDMFTRRKVKVLEDMINSRFVLARFKMFNILVNGGLEECCEVTYDGVPYSAGLNHGARVQVGMDIVRTLQDHFSFLPPVWVDQSESITTLPEMECQVIRLVVSPTDEELRIESTVGS